MRIQPQIILIFMAVVALLGVVAVAQRRIEAESGARKACRDACFPFVHQQVVGRCYCYTVEGDLKLNKGK